MKKFFTILMLILIFISGCATQEWSEEMYNTPKFTIHCFSDDSLSTHPDIKSGRAKGLVEQKNGDIHMYVTCTKISGKLHFDNAALVTHELQEILHQYHLEWADPDKLLKRKQKE